jgi:hypothetical protein
MAHAYSYEATLAVAERINWRVEDVIGQGKRLDFSRPFLPESLARVGPLTFLTADEKRILNQIRGHGYLYTFGLVEEFILPFVTDQARTGMMTEQYNDYEVRALLEFAGEEAKHIHLFKRFKEEFDDGFGSHCEVIGPPHELARAVLAHDPLGIAFAILQIEWMTQRHYTDSVQDDQDLDPQFKSLLKHHWMEEAQHAKLDTLMVQNLAAGMAPEQIGRAVDAYLEIGVMLDQGLEQQARFDLDSLERAVGRTLPEAERAPFLAVQHQALRWTYLGSGMTHRNFLGTLGDLQPSAQKRIEEIAPAFC